MVRNREGKTFIHFYETNNFECLYEVDPETVGQFTCLHDKNRREIYGGDIVKAHDQIGVVESIPGRFEVRWIKGYNSYLWQCTTEVIGNIYENPNLLEDK